MAKKGAAGTDRVFMENAIKTLATNIRFASVDKTLTSIAVTSSIPNEGKTTIAVALARAMAEGGKGVLLVECDMRRRTIAGLLGAHARSGIYSVLSGQVKIEDAAISTSTRGLSFLDCEPHIPNPVDILSSKRFRTLVGMLEQHYDFVIFDTPPLSAFIDAAVIGQIVGGTLLVVRQSFVKRDELLAAHEQLQKAGANVIGAVMNYCESEKSEYYYSYYSTDGKEKDKSRASAPQITPASPSPRTVAAARPAQAPRPVTRRAVATPRPAATPAPIVSPNSTAQFLAGTAYRPRDYSDE